MPRKSTSVFSPSFSAWASSAPRKLPSPMITKRGRPASEPFTSFNRAAARKNNEWFLISVRRPTMPMSKSSSPAFNSARSCGRCCSQLAKSERSIPNGITRNCSRNPTRKCSLISDLCCSPRTMIRSVATHASIRSIAKKMRVFRGP